MAQTTQSQLRRVNAHVAFDVSVCVDADTDDAAKEAAKKHLRGVYGKTAKITKWQVVPMGKVLTTTGK